MLFAEKLKDLRKKSGMSQEKLAEKIGVSRQAVTKWENDTGVPDIANLKAVSELFGVSIDELLSDEKGSSDSGDYVFESVTEYDIAEPKRYDIKLGGAKTVNLSGYDGEKILVRLASDSLPNIKKDYKVKIDDIRKRIDVDLIRMNGAAESEAKENLTVFVKIPSKYMDSLELAVSARNVELCSLECDAELDVKAENVVLDGVKGNVEIDCNLDMNIVCRTLNGKVDINQIYASSKITVPDNAAFTAVSKGKATNIYFERDGKRCDPFDLPDAENIIELNGMKSELLIVRGV